MSGYTDVCEVKEIKRETEKAILIDYARERMVWLPKSCVMIKDGCVFAKNWIAKKNAIGVYGARSCRVG